MAAQLSSPPVTVHTSPWHSPVPYLFGGLAAMMCLIVFALWILACSYWKFSRNLHSAGDGDIEAGDGDVKPDNNKIPIVFEPMCVVILAGEEKPTFLATPSSSRTSSFGSNSCQNSLPATEGSSASEMEKDERSDQGQVSTMGSHESAEQML